MIEYLRNKFSCSEIYLDVEPENKIATNLYKKAGFKNTDKKHGESPIYKLDLSKYKEDF